MVWSIFTWLALSLAAALRAVQRSDADLGAAALIAAALAFLVARWLFTASEQPAMVGALLLTGGLILYRRPAAPPARPLPFWAGLVIITGATALKCIALDDWPLHLNEYSAETGYWGLRTLDGLWPRDFFAGKEYDLVNGGISPLHLPVLWGSVRLFGGTIAAVRFAEVFSSTVLLVLFWVWLRRHWRGGAGLTALAVYAISPWHLAQSRMGTFFSASVALGLTLLILAERIIDGAAPAERSAARLPGMAEWVGFGAAAGLIGYAYAPLKVLYAYFVLVLGAALVSGRGRQRAAWRGPLAAGVVFGAILAVQLAGAARFEEMFRRDFGVLATDTSIWKKTADDQVTQEIQPVSVVARNLLRNLTTWWRTSWSERRVLVWYAPALTGAVVAALVLLWRGPHRVTALYCAIGMLPPLIIYPVQRRTLILWPLVYVAAVVGGWELTRICAARFARAWWHVLSWTLFGAGLIHASAHGLHIYATTNSIVGTGQYFGPDHQLDMYLEAERMLPRCRVYLVNPTYEEAIVATVRLFAASRRIVEPEPFGFFDFKPGDDRPDVLLDRPLCFFDLNRPDENDIEGGVVDGLAEHFLDGMILRRWAGDGSDTLFYNILMVPAQETGEDE